MEFFNLNAKKIGFRFLINTIISFIMILILGSIRKENYMVDLNFKLQLLAILPFLITLFTVALNYLKFNLGIRVLTNENGNEIKSVFDNNCEIKNTNINSIFKYSFKCLSGKIRHFSCTISYELDIYPGWVTRSKNYFQCRFAVKNRFDQNVIDEFQVPIKTTFKAELSKDVKEDIQNHVQVLIQKYEPSDYDLLN